LTDVFQSPAPAPSAQPTVPVSVDAPLFEKAEFVEANEKIAADADPDRKAWDRLESLPAEEAALEAVKLRRRRREREGFADPPIAERKYPDALKRDKDGDWEGTRSLDEASKDLSFSRLMERGSALLNRGFSSDDAVAIVNNDLQYGKPSETPLTKVALVREDGSVAQEIADCDGPILGLDPSIAIKNPREAAKFVANYRDAVAAQQQALLNEIQQREVAQQQQAEQAPQEARQAEQTRAAKQKRAQEQQQAEAARAQLAQQQAALQWERQATDEEKNLVNVYRSWEQWAQKIPELMDFAALEVTRQTKPARYNEIMKQAQRGKQIQAKAVARSQELFELRQGRALQAAAQQQAQAVAARSQYNEAQDTRFEEALKKELPEFATGDARKALNKAAKEELRSYGMTDQQIGREYDYGQLRSAEAQMMLAKAAVHRLVRENRIAVASKRAPLPPVQTPGTARPRGAGDMERVRDLQGQLANARGRKSLDIAQKLTRARRAAGML
jgi:hypothetical protein